MSSIFQKLATSAKKAAFELSAKKVIIHWEGLTTTGFTKKGAVIIEGESFDPQASLTAFRQTVDRLERQKNATAAKMLKESFKITSWRPATYEDLN